MIFINLTVLGSQRIFSISTRFFKWRKFNENGKMENCENIEKHILMQSSGLISSCFLDSFKGFGDVEVEVEFLINFSKFSIREFSIAQFN
jgi:hypothetical protein